jgi:LemA protein
MWPAIIIGILAVSFILIFVGMYNGLVKKRVQVQNAWAQIDVQLKRRYDLIPNLVETVKGFMKHEQETLEKVIQARSQALQAKTVGDKAKAEAAVAGALSGIFGLSEAYPELTSNKNMLELQEELRSTENKISFARQYYNDVVTNYNTQIEVFPSSVIASMFTFQPEELFEIDDPVQREAVKVKF